MLAKYSWCLDVLLSVHVPEEPGLRLLWFSTLRTSEFHPQILVNNQCLVGNQNEISNNRGIMFQGVDEKHELEDSYRLVKQIGRTIFSLIYMKKMLCDRRRVCLQ